jgi:hypothetical protein
VAAASFQEQPPDVEENANDRLGQKHPHTLESWYDQIDLYEAWNKPEKAKEWRAKLPQMVNTRK